MTYHHVTGGIQMVIIFVRLQDISVNTTLVHMYASTDRFDVPSRRLPLHKCGLVLKVLIMELYNYCYSRELSPFQQDLDD